MIVQILFACMLIMVIASNWSKKNFILLISMFALGFNFCGLMLWYFPSEVMIERCLIQKQQMEQAELK